MQKRKMPRDRNQLAAQIVAMTTGDIAAEATNESTPAKSVSEKNPAAVALGRLGGLKGGKARAAKLSPAQRRKIAKRAAKARWK
jgi:hypothetical protein